MFDNYKIYTDNATKVVAVSTYAGKAVRGIAKCNPEDTFDLNYGTKLAKARCNYNVAKMRLKDKVKQEDYAFMNLIDAVNDSMLSRERLETAIGKFNDAKKHLEKILDMPQ